MHLQFVTIPIQRLGFSGGLPGNYTLLSYHSIFPSLLSCPLPSTPPLQLTQLLCHCMAPKCYSSPVFEKPFHFSLLSGTCSNGLLLLHKVPSGTHIQPNTRWPFATSDSGCNYDSPNALLNCIARLLLARQSRALCCIRTMEFSLFNSLRIDTTLGQKAKMETWWLPPKKKISHIITSVISSKHVEQT